MPPFMMSAVNIALPAIQIEFAVNAVLLSWLGTSYLLATAVFLMPVGKIADIYGRKKTFTWGILFFTLSALWAGFAPSVYWLIFIRVLQGISGAMIMTTGVAMLTSVFPPHERGKVMGINVAAVYIGLSAGPFIGGFVTQNFDWRGIFFLSVPIGMATTFLILRYLKDEWADARGQGLDIFGSVIYGFALVALIYGASLLPERAGIWLMICGLLGIGAFVKRQLTVEEPVFEVRLFHHNRTFAFSNIAALINYSATTAVTFLLSLYLQYIKGMEPQMAGVVLIAQPIIQAVLSPYTGKLSDRVDPGLLATMGMSLTALGLFLFIFLGPNSSLFFIIIPLIILGFGYALFSSPNMNAIMGSVEKQYYGIASAAVATMRLIGQMLSMATATVIFALFIGRAEITPANYLLFLKSTKTAFIIFTCLCVIGIFFSFSRGAIERERQ
ncbi:MAG: MFS transporter [Bacillota bacterium]|nr:MFS transporter [Bacillota bacterium]